MNFIFVIILVEVLCALGVLADYYLKIAGSGPGFMNIRMFLIGFVFHSSTAIGWFLVLKYMKLVQVGVFYSVSIVLMLTILGIYHFNEQLHPREAIGLILAVISLVLLARFS